MGLGRGRASRCQRQGPHPEGPAKDRLTRISDWQVQGSRKVIHWSRVKTACLPGSIAAGNVFVLEPRGAGVQEAAAAASPPAAAGRAWPGRDRVANLGPRKGGREGPSLCVSGRNPIHSRPADRCYPCMEPCPLFHQPTHLRVGWTIWRRRRESFTQPPSPRHPPRSGEEEQIRRRSSCFSCPSARPA